MFYKIAQGKSNVTYFDTDARKKYVVEIGHLYGADDNSFYDMNVIIAWEYEYDENGREMDDLSPVHLLEYFMGATEDINEAIEFLQSKQKDGKEYIVKF